MKTFDFDKTFNKVKQNILALFGVLACLAAIVLTWLIPLPGTLEVLVTHWVARLVAVLGAGAALVLTARSMQGTRFAPVHVHCLLFCASIATVLFSFAIAWHLRTEYFRYEFLLLLIPAGAAAAGQAAAWSRSAPAEDKETRFWKNLGWWLIPLLLVSVLVFCLSTLVYVRTLRFEDTFITFRYGWNLAQGNGINWNVTDPAPAEGYTTFTWVLLSAFFFFLHLDPLPGTQVVSLLLLPLLGYFVWGLMREIYGSKKIVALLPFALLIGLPATGFHVATGMETLLYSACLAGTAYFAVRSFKSDYADKKYAYLFGLMVLASGLTRPDGVVYGIVTLGVLVWLSGRKALCRDNWLALFLTLGFPGVIYFAWRLAYFKQLLPLSFYHKSFVGDLYGHATRSVLFTDFVGMILLPFLIFILYRVFSRTLPKSAYIALIPSVVLVLYYSRVLAVAGLQYRFFFPYLFAFLIAAADDVTNLFGWLASRTSRFLLPVTAVLLVLYFCAAPFFYETRNIVTFSLNGYTYDERSDDYMRIGKTLLNLDRAEPIGIGEVGKIGMLLRNYTLVDIIGLNDAYLARHPFSTSYLDQRGVNILITFAYPGAPLGVYADVYRKVGEGFKDLEQKFTCIGNIRGFDVFVRQSPPTRPEAFVRTLSQSRDFDAGICLSKTAARWSPKSFPLNLESWSFHDVRRLDDNSYTFQVTGNDPILSSPRLALDAQDYNNVIVKALIPPPVECHTFTLYFTREDAPAESEERSIYVPFDPAPQVQEIVANVRMHAGWRGRIERLRIDPVCGLNRDGSEIRFRIESVMLQ